MPAVGIHRDKGKVSFDLHVRPAQRPLGSDEEATLRLLADGGPDAPSVLVAEVDTKGGVLLGPAAAPADV
jgi:hypothetical protein